MSRGNPTKILLADASVLIDYVAADAEILGLLATIYELHVALPILREVKSLPRSKAEALGLNIHEPALEELFEAAQHGGSLSEQDKLCLAIARGHQWGCLTNDRALRQYCQKSGIPVVWGLEVMIILHKEGQLSRARAIKTAEAIHAANPLHIGTSILKEFIRKIGA